MTVNTNKIKKGSLDIKCVYLKYQIILIVCIDNLLPYSFYIHFFSFLISSVSSGAADGLGIGVVTD